MTQKIIAAVWLLCFIFAYATAQTNHTQLLYQDFLDQASSGTFQSMENRNGQFLTGQGWKAITSKSQLKITLPSVLPFEGTMIIDVTNFDPVSQNIDTKQQIINLYSQGNGSKDIFDTDGSWINIRTGTGYSTGPGVAGFKLLCAPRGIDTRDEVRCIESATWNTSKKYQFKLVWNEQTVTVFLDGKAINSLPFKGQIEAFRYIFLGTDNVYVAQPGPIYSNLRLYAADSVVILPSNIKFTDITSSAGTPGYSANGYGQGVSFVDVNADDKLDFFVTNALPGKSLLDLLYINRGNNQFGQESGSRKISDPGLSNVVLNADFDLDGDLDVFFSNVQDESIGFTGRNTLYRNDGAGVYENISDWAGLPNQASKSRGAVAVDIDRDGDLDLFIANQGAPNELYLNDGTGKFTRVNRGTDGPTEDPAKFGKQGVTVGDIDNDGDPDIYLCRRKEAADPAPNWLFVNDGKGYFTEQAQARGVDYDGRSHGAQFVDIDNDGDLDLFVANFMELGTTELPLLGAFINRGDGTFENRSGAYNIAVSGYSLLFADLDDDGDQDLYLLRNDEKEPGARPQLYLNDGTGQLTLAGNTGLEVAAKDLRTAAYGDIDQDGDSDVYVVAKDGQNFLLRNDSYNDNHWLDVLCLGPRGDLGGFGSKVYVYKAGRLGDNSQILGFQESVSNLGYFAQNQTALHFGLGSNTTCDIRIVQTNGQTFDYSNIAADQVFRMPAAQKHQLRYVSGSEQSGLPDTKLPAPLVVQLIDQQGTPVPNVPVQFVVIQGDGEIEPSQTISTDANGIASAYLIAGKETDTYRVEARCENTLGSPILFTAIIQNTSVSLVPVSGDNQTGVVADTLMQPIVVRTETGGSPVPNVPVTFKILTGNGKLDGQESLTLNSDATGLVRVRWILGQLAGQQKMSASAGVSTVDFAAIAAADVPKIMLPIGATPNSVIPGKEFPEPFGAKITDRYGNSVANHPVSFIVTGGGGNLRGVGSVTHLTDSNGLASVYWTPGPYRGPEQKLTASSQYDGQPLTNSSIIWRIPGIQVDPQKSTITATSPILADGESQSAIMITLRNKDNQSVGAGLTVRVLVSGSDNTVLTPDSLTDSSGQVRFYLSSTLAETKIVHATVLGLGMTLADSAIVQVQPLPAARKLQYVSGSSQTALVSRALQKPFLVRVVNAQNQPVIGEQVEFSIVTGGGSFNGQPRIVVVSDPEGLAGATLVLGPNAGVQQAVARLLNSPDQTITFEALAKIPINEKMVKLAGEGQTGIPGQTLPIPLRIAITDSSGHPIANRWVTFQVIEGGGSFNGQTVWLTPTDSDGMAQVVFTLGATVGTHLVKVFTDLTETNFSLTAIQPLKADLSRCTLSATSPVLADGIKRSEISVKIIDTSGNPMANAGVELIVSGSGHTITQPPTTDHQGTTTGFLSSLIAEEKTITALILPDREAIVQKAVVKFVAEWTFLEIVSGDLQTQIVTRQLAQPLVVQLTRNGQSVTDFPVRFSIHAGQAHFDGQNELVTSSNSAGRAMAQPILGTKTGEVKIKVEATGFSPVYFTIGVKPEVAAKLSIVSGNNQISAPGSTLPEKLTVLTTDFFNNATPNTLVNFAPLDGGAILKQANVVTDDLGYAACEALLGMEMRLYQFFASLSNGASVLFTAEAAFINQPPKIVDYEPKTDSMTVYYGELVRFRIIDVVDAQGDSIHYVWKMNGLILSQQSVFQLVSNPTLPKNLRVVCLVHDRRDTTRLAWRITLEPQPAAVDLLQFQAQVLGYQQVQLTWRLQPTLRAKFYRVLKSEREDGPFHAIRSGETEIGAEEIVIHDNTFSSSRTMYYKLEIITEDGSNQVFGPYSVAVANPTEMTLFQNYPNPFNPNTIIAFDLTESMATELTISDLSGRVLRILLREKLPAGHYEIPWDARNDANERVSSGVYLYRLRTEKSEVTRKLILIK